MLRWRRTSRGLSARPAVQSTSPGCVPTTRGVLRQRSREPRRKYALIGSNKQSGFGLQQSAEQRAERHGESAAWRIERIDNRDEGGGGVVAATGRWQRPALQDGDGSHWPSGFTVSRSCATRNPCLTGHTLALKEKPVGSSTLHFRQVRARVAHPYRVADAIADVDGGEDVPQRSSWTQASCLTSPFRIDDRQCVRRDGMQWNGYAQRATMSVSISGDAGFSRRMTVEGRSPVGLYGSPERMTIRI